MAESIHNHLRLVVTPSVSGTTASWLVQVYSVSWGYNDAQWVDYSGAPGSGRHNYTATSPGSGSVLLTSFTVTASGARGTTLYASFAVGGAYDGSAPALSNVPVTIPVIAPGTPSNLASGTVTTTTVPLTWSAPPTWNGHNSGDYDVGYTPSGGSETVVSVLDAVAKTLTGLDPNTEYSIRVRAKNSAGAGSWTSPITVTTAPLAPDPPTGLSVTRVNDTKQTVAWTNNPSAPKPITGNVIYRSTNGGAAANIATVAGTATSFDDTGTVANRKYVYDVASTNSGGSSTLQTAGTVFTTPSPVTTVTAAKTETNDALITITAPSGYAEREYVVDYWDGTSWTDEIGVIDYGDTTFTHVGPGTAAPIKYRVRTRTTSGATLTSTAVESNTLAIASPPNAPSGLAPNGSAVDATEDNDLTWVHVPTDSSPQRKYQIRHRVSGGPTWTTESEATSVTSLFELVADTYTNGQSIEWQVRTWGQHDDPSDWSASATFTTRSRPTGTFTDPTDSEEVGYSAIIPSWVFYQAQSDTQIGYRLTLLHSSNVLEVKTGTTATSRALSTRLQDGEEYTLRIEVQASSGLWSEPSDITITVSYLPPVAFSLVALYDADTASVSLTPEPEDVETDVTVAAESIAIQRRIDGGDWITLVEGISPTSAVVDTQPATVGTNEYRIIATSSIPSTLITGEATVVTEDLINGWLSTGPAFDELLMLPSAITLNGTAGRAKVVQYFLNRTRGVEFSGGNTTELWVVTGTVKGTRGAAMLRALAKTEDIVLWRDPTGYRAYGSIGQVTLTLRDIQVPDLWNVTFVVTEVDYDG